MASHEGNESHGANPHFSLLIVEDDYEASEIMRAMTAMTFPKAEILVAENGRRGLEICSKHRPDIVITDVNMPLVDGITMAVAMRELEIGTRLIVVTGYGNKIEGLQDIGAHECMAKPIRFKKLFAAIRRCMKEIQRERQA